MMQYKPYHLINIIILSLLIIQWSHAVGLEKRHESALYEASVKVETDKSENELIDKAFTQVLIKVSGRSDVTQLTEYAALLKHSKNSISQFRYDYRSSVKIADTEQNIPDDKKESEKEKWFWVQFDAKSVDNLLKEALLPVWGNTRPVTLIWFSQELKGNRVIQNQQDAPTIYTVLEEKSKQRGISLIFPFFDLQDKNNISANDIWGSFNDTILVASSRYQAQATLTIRLFKQKNGMWVSQWNLLLLGNSQTWTIRNKNREFTLSLGIDKLADYLARQFTPVYDRENDSGYSLDEDEGILIQINNVSNYTEFQRLDNYFNSLATVKSVVLAQAQQDRLIYKITYLGDKNSLIQEIKLGDILNSINRSNLDNRFNEDKEYQSVILDDLDKKSVQNQVEQLPEQSEQAAETVVEKSTQKPAQLSIKPEKLIPDLEYWLGL